MCEMKVYFWNDGLQAGKGSKTTEGPAKANNTGARSKRVVQTHSKLPSVQIKVQEIRENRQG